MTFLAARKAVQQRNGVFFFFDQHRSRSYSIHTSSVYLFFLIARVLVLFFFFKPGRLLLFLISNLLSYFYTVW